MTVKQANQELQLMTWPQKDAMYNNVFVNSAGRDDETQFDIHGEKTLEETAEELSSLFAGFCNENGFTEDSVQSIYYAGPIV